MPIGIPKHRVGRAGGRHGALFGVGLVQHLGERATGEGAERVGSRLSAQAGKRWARHRRAARTVVGRHSDGWVLAETRAA